MPSNALNSIVLYIYIYCTYQWQKHKGQDILHMNLQLILEKPVMHTPIYWGTILTTQACATELTHDW